MELLKNAYIYCFKNQDKIIYIGKTHQLINNRLKQHLTHCHNKKLKEYLQSQNPPTFEIIYESHNKITEEILCSIEQSYIETLKPKCNILGVEKPYDLFKKKSSIDHFNINNKISDIDVEIIMENNPQIKEVRLESIFNIIHNVNPGQENKISEQRAVNKVLESYYGKLNDFNKRDYYHPITGNFQQKVWCAIEQNNQLRFLTNEEKYFNESSSNIKITQARLLFHYYTDEEYQSIVLNPDNYNSSEDFSDLYFRKMYFLDPNHLTKYHPLKCKKVDDQIIYEYNLDSDLLSF